MCNSKKFKFIKEKEAKGLSINFIGVNILVSNIAKNPKRDGYQPGLSSMVYKFFDKKLEVKQFKN